MSEVQETVQETVVTETPTETPVVEGNPEQAAETPVQVQETPPEETPPAETPPDTPRLYKIKVDGAEEEHTEEELIELAAKGASFGRKAQALSEWEKANQQELQLSRQLLSNPNAVKMLVAEQLGYNPLMVMGDPQPPDPSLRDTNPELYGQAIAYYQIQLDQKQRFDRAVENFSRQTAVTTNNALFERVRITQELNDQEYQDVVRFVNENMRPNSLGVYSDRQIEAAVKAVVGQDREAKTKLDRSNKIQQQLKTIAKTPPKKVNAKPEKLTDREKAEREFTEFVKEKSAMY